VGGTSDQSSEFHSTETVNVANWRLISLVLDRLSFSGQFLKRMNGGVDPRTKEQVWFTFWAGESGRSDEIVVKMKQFSMMKRPWLVFNCSVPQPITTR
jgi:hypothetical protein